MLKQKGIEPKRVASTNGGEYASPCPKCGGKDRFRVWPEQDNGEGGFYCRGCDKGGDAVQFLVDYCGMSYPEAFKEAGRDMPVDYGKIDKKYPKKKPAFRPKDVNHPEGVDVEKWRQHAGKMVDWAHEKLLNNQDQLAYLAGRGITVDTIKKYRLGYNPGENGRNAIFRPRESWGLPTVMKGGKPKRLWIPRGIVIPVFLDGDLRRVRIRRPNEDLTPDFDTRYYILPGSAMMPMLINPDRKSFVVIETELDGCLIDQEAGDLVGVLALGSCSLKPDSRSCDALRSSFCILNALDFDGAGAKARTWWDENFDQAKRWPVPVGTDPGEAYQAGLNLRDWLLAGLPPAWHVGQSALSVTKKGAADFKASPETGNSAVDIVGKGVDLPESVKRLYEYLKKYPVKIRCDAKRLAVEKNPKWENSEVFKEVSRLVFFDADCFDYVHAHPESIITGKTFLFN